MPLLRFFVFILKLELVELQESHWSQLILCGVDDFTLNEDYLLMFEQGTIENTGLILASLTANVELKLLLL